MIAARYGAARASILASPSGNGSVVARGEIERRSTRQVGTKAGICREGKERQIAADGIPAHIGCANQLKFASLFAAARQRAARDGYGHACDVAAGTGHRVPLNKALGGES